MAKSSQHAPFQIPCRKTFTDPRKNAPDTLSKTNVAPENRPSQKKINLPTPTFLGLYVSFRERISYVLAAYLLGGAPITNISVPMLLTSVK